MAPEERQQLSAFLQQLVEARVPARNADAEALIREACALQPDATYLLVQRALLQDMALANAQREVAELKDKLAAAQTTLHAAPRSFLDGAWGRSAAPASNNAPTPAQPAVPQRGFTGPQSGGWLGQVATTAAGVVAGSFLFQGIENLMGNHHSRDLWGGERDGSKGSDTASSADTATHRDNGNASQHGADATPYDVSATDASSWDASDSDDGGDYI